MSDNQMKGFLEEVLGYEETDELYEFYLDRLLTGYPIRIPINWIKEIPEFETGCTTSEINKRFGIGIRFHKSSAGVIFAQRIHPVIEAYLDKEKIEYEFKCDPYLGINH